MYCLNHRFLTLPYVRTDVCAVQFAICRAKKMFMYWYHLTFRVSWLDYVRRTVHTPPKYPPKSRLPAPGLNHPPKTCNPPTSNAWTQPYPPTTTANLSISYRKLHRPLAIVLLGHCSAPWGGLLASAVATFESIIQVRK